MKPALPHNLQQQVLSALQEDLSPAGTLTPSDDLSAQLVPSSAHMRAEIIAREAGVLCGCAWVDAVFAELGNKIVITWHKQDGEQIEADECLCELQGPARILLSGERTALNFLQTLSATATATQVLADQVHDLPVRILDTRKTIPGLRSAQKYAVTCGGGHNHRMGLYDAYLIKENHIASCGGIAAAIAQARVQGPGHEIEVEVENLDELKQALAASADRILLDNFNLPQLREAVALNRTATTPARLEASGNISGERLRAIAETGVDDISIGALTKHIHALDLSMRLHPIETENQP
jgi:nicotinate-nucleotide pyrophosphorylase (carboxylating)